MNYDEKLKKLERTILDMGNLAVAFSGGVDSTFLLLFAKKVIDAHNEAVTRNEDLPSSDAAEQNRKVNFSADMRLTAISADGPNFAPDEMTYAVKLCKEAGIAHLVVDLGPEFLTEIADNTKDRCYLCKKFIFSRLKQAVGHAYTLADGTNADDSKDFRPGRKALKELGIRSPLEECEFTKEEIRRGLKDMQVSIWNKPAFACLASRIPYGQTITAQKLQSIYAAELILKDLGFDQVRVRCHNDVARIEVPPQDRAKFFDVNFMDRLNKTMKICGFKYIALDLGGYVMGNLNS